MQFQQSPINYWTSLQVLCIWGTSGGNTVCKSLSWGCWFQKKICPAPIQTCPLFLPGTPRRRLTDRKLLFPNTGQRSFCRKLRRKKYLLVEPPFLPPWWSLPISSKKKQVVAKWVWNVWLGIGEVAKLRFSRSLKFRAEFGIYSVQESGGGVHTNQLRKHREIHLWTLITIKWMCLNRLSSFAMAGENLLIRPLDQGRPWEKPRCTPGTTIFPLAAPFPSRESESKFKDGWDFLIYHSAFI